MYNEGTPGGPPAGYNEGGGTGAGAITALLQLGGSLYDSHQNRKAARQNTDKTIAANKAEAELAYQRQLQMWHMQNAYNSPEAQMARFRAGGLNPNLIYGQGNPGNASPPPAYQPPHMQYRYESGNYGAALTSLIPTLMSVGTWMQNMRLSQADLKNKENQSMRTEQLIEFLKERNPKELQLMQQKQDLFPYQLQTQRYMSDIARSRLFTLEQDFRQMFGEELFAEHGSSFGRPGTGEAPTSPIGGMKRLQFLEQQGKLQSQGYQNRLLEAKSSWTDMDITDPQAIMMMVMNSVMGLAGQTMRFARKPVAMPSGTRSGSRERPRGLVRRRMGPNHPDR